MSSENDETPYSESHLDSPEYRQRLMRKLNTLIAVLEVACAKVRRSLAGPEPDTDRLNRIHKNLKDTLRVCTRAKAALERSEKLPADFPEHLARATGAQGIGEFAGAKQARSQQSELGSAVEMTSREETEKFERLGPINPKELRGVDIDDLCRRLSS